VDKEHPDLRALLDLLPDRLEVVPLGFHLLKGLPDPVEVFGLLAMREPPAHDALERS
jgi:hypothetical protein